MTIWVPKLDDRLPTRYEQIAQAIERDIAAGILKPGDKLPTQRALAKSLNVTVATCGRGYALAASRGLTKLEVGRGSFVAEPTEVLDQDIRPGGGLVIDLRINLPPRLHDRTIYSQSLQGLAASRQVEDLFGVLPVESYPRHREAAANWLQGRIDSAAENVLIVAGMQSALISSLSALAKPGDQVLVESFTFPGMLAAAQLLQLKLIPIEMDRRGILVDDFRAKSGSARLVYLNPTNQNPTSAVLPLSRRKAIARIIRQQQQWLIEDDTYGHFFGQDSPPIARFAPERSLYISSLSKSMSVGLRLAFMRIPESIYEQVLARFRATSFFPTPLSVEIATQWIEDGTAGRLTKQLQEVADRRQRIAHEVLGGRRIHGRPRLNHIWMSVPAPWTAESLVQAARENGVLLSTASSFSPVGDSRNDVRIALGGARNDEELKVALAKIARLIDLPDSKDVSRY